MLFAEEDGSEERKERSDSEAADWGIEESKRMCFGGSAALLDQLPISIVT